MASARPKVSIVLVNWNSLRYLPGCFDSIDAQTLRSIEVIVVDNGSTDGSFEWLQHKRPRAKIIQNLHNTGFCVANNQGIEASSGEFVLLMNTDVVLDPEFLEVLVFAIESDPRVGWASGKLLRGPKPKDGTPPLIDSAGERFFQTLRMVNRGEEERDEGQFDEREEVFGVTAAAALYRREMLEDIRLGDDYFDSEYFAYLEDSDLNWRAQLRGWKCIYEPSTTADHIRQHATSRASPIQRHAFANRYLSILKNASLSTIFRLLPHLALYELHRVVKTTFRRPSMMLSYLKVARQFIKSLRKRRAIQRGRRASSKYIRSWMEPEAYGAELRSRYLPGATKRESARELVS